MHRHRETSVTHIGVRRQFRGGHKRFVLAVKHGLHRRWDASTQRFSYETTNDWTIIWLAFARDGCNLLGERRTSKV
jgi:hypothetical protein